jgi:chromate reductase
VVKTGWDVTSRINPKVYQSKPMVLLATSPGEGGGSNVLSTAMNSMSFFDGIVKGSFSLPSFYDNYDIENNVVSNEELATKLKKEVESINV